MKVLPLAAMLLLFASSCVTTRPATPAADTTRGNASWYGEEFAGRTTANGEIFEPSKLTAAHRTLPFGTIVEVRNLTNDRTVQVRINDRGPFIGGRIIDLSYGAAKQIGMVEQGVGVVELKVVRLGAGELEPPQPTVVVAQRQQAPPPVRFPLPEQTGRAPAIPESSSADEEVVVDQIVVEEIRGTTPVRRQVAPDGTSIEEVPIDDDRGIEAPRIETSRPVTPAAATVTPGSQQRQFDVQFGAFASEANARSLADEIRAADADVRVEAFRDLFRVRVGPFPTREAAIDASERLARRGFKGIVVPSP